MQITPHISLGAIVTTPNVEVNKGLIEFSDRITATMGDLFKITNQCITKLVNYITQTDTK